MKLMDILSQCKKDDRSYIKRESWIDPICMATDLICDSTCFELEDFLADDWEFLKEICKCEEDQCGYSVATFITFEKALDIIRNDETKGMQREDFEDDYYFFKDGKLKYYFLNAGRVLSDNNQFNDKEDIYAKWSIISPIHKLL